MHPPRSLLAQTFEMDLLSLLSLKADDHYAHGIVWVISLHSEDHALPEGF